LGTKGSKDETEFSRRASTYERSCAQPLMFDRVHRVVLDLVASQCGGIAPQRVLDVGCGTGRLLRKVGAHWPAAELTGVDATEEMIEVARRSTPAATFYVGVAESLPLPDDSMDMVLSTDSLHHWNDRAAGVREVTRVLRPGGRFFLADIWIPAALANMIRHFRPTNPYARKGDFAILQEFFVQAGLQVELQRQAPAPFGLLTVGLKS
jgi:ubiquinone/menaquinone biosynthesis C-methylase UbiE